MDNGRSNPNRTYDATQRRRSLDRVAMAPRGRLTRLSERVGSMVRASREVPGTVAGRLVDVFGGGSKGAWHQFRHQFRRGSTGAWRQFRRRLERLGQVSRKVPGTLRYRVPDRPPTVPGTVLVVLCLGLACTRPDAPVRTRPDTPADPPTQAQTTQPADDDGLELTGVVSQAVVKEIDDEELRDAAATEPVLGALILRVGLATDLERVDLPCCGGEVKLHYGDTTVPLDRRTVVLPAAGIGQTAIYRLQVAALKDELQAQGIADYLNAETSYPAESVFDADTDLYRVRVGRFASREEAETAQGGLAGLGVTQSWVVSEGGELENAAFVVRRAAGPGEAAATESATESRWEGRWLDLYSETAHAGLPFERHLYRGRLLLFLNDRGLINVINELPLEDYLRGVVPKEMGPELYNELEALKAQTVAARTYTLRNLGEFAGEGYDICSTPRCQVYGGMAWSTRSPTARSRRPAARWCSIEARPPRPSTAPPAAAIPRTSRWSSRSSTARYLRGVPCLEAGSTTIRGD